MPETHRRTDKLIKLAQQSFNVTDRFLEQRS